MAIQRSRGAGWSPWLPLALRAIQSTASPTTHRVDPPNRSHNLQIPQKKAETDLKKALSTLEKHLLLRTYVVGEAITLADIVLVAALYYPFKLVLDSKTRTPFPSVTRWFITCVNQPEFAAVLGEVALAETAMTAAGKAGAAAAAPAAKKEEKKKEEKPKAEAPKAAEKPKKKKDEDDDGGDDDMAAFVEPKKNDPFAALPPSTMVLDEWKRTYSNTRTEGA